METITNVSGGVANQPQGKASPAERRDRLTAQKVEVGIILQAMLGTQAALEYMDNNAIHRSVAARVLNQPEMRRGRHDAHGIQVAAG